MAAVEAPFEASIARGVAALDDKAPDWRDRVDAERLDMGETEVDEDGCGCICGQVFGSFDQGVAALARFSPPLATPDLARAYAWAEQHGFADRRGRYADLTEAWRRELAKGPHQ